MMKKVDITTFPEEKDEEVKNFVIPMTSENGSNPMITNQDEVKKILGLKDKYPRSVKTETGEYIAATMRFRELPQFRPLTEEEKKKLNDNLKAFHAE